MLRNSGMRPMPSGSNRQTSSVTPGRMVGLIMPTTPRQLENAMRESFRFSENVGAGLSPAPTKPLRCGSPRCAAVRAVFFDERNHRFERLHRVRLERMLVEEGMARAVEQ